MSESRLFQPLALRGVELPNRIVVSPMCMYSAIDGCATAWHHVHLGSLACSGCGLVIIEATAVEARGRITPDCLGLWGDSQERALARVLATVREISPTPIAIQLAHAGRKASHRRPWSGRGHIDAEQGGWQAAGPSSNSYEGNAPPAAAMDKDDLREVRLAFVEATNRAARIGVDALELHSAHGYLLSSFLSPLANERTDEYGGSLANRMRYPLEIFEAMREAWPEEKPLGVRFSGTDWADDRGGWTVQDTETFAAALADRGCDFLDVSSGGNVAAEIESGPGFQVPFAAAAKKASGLPTIAVGELDDPELAEAILQRGEADAIAIARGFIRNPRWPWLAAQKLDGMALYPPQYAWCVGDR
ncbi:MAG: NADH:flavin oxidoreductase/NADH oxidase, partial [Phycisphaerales bacterium]|nr:NADH:flavin oxidoreductase/NADH oxidase [Phycisphaerales bacterium]